VLFFRKKQQVAICVVAVMLVADFLWFGCLPLHKATKAINQTKAALALAIVKGTAGSRQMPALSEQLQKLQAAVSNYEVNVPSQRALGVFLQQLANLMTEHGLTEQVVAPGMEIKADGLNCIPIDMQCKGRLTQVFEFYKRLQRLDRLVRIEQAKFTNDNSFDGQVNMQTKVVIYYRPEVEPDREHLGESQNI